MDAGFDQESIAADFEQRFVLDGNDENNEENIYSQETRISHSPSRAQRPRLELVHRRETYPDSPGRNNNSSVSNNNNGNNSNRSINISNSSLHSNSRTNSHHLTSRARNPSPLSRSHLRPRAHTYSLVATAPPMLRAQSLPSVPSAGRLVPSPSASPALAPSSPLPSPSPRSTSPFSLRFDDTSPSLYDGAIESISEDAELDLTPRQHVDHMPHISLNSSRSLSVRRQRPTSPLHSLANSGAATHSTSSRSTSGASSPSVGVTRFTEGYPSLHHYSSNSSFSSMPSTPTSTRSRSPSISSLETIEDAPDLEWEAIEADREAKQKATEEYVGKGSNDHDNRRRGSLEIPGARSGFGFGRRGADANRKRWSICGGERRADLDLETIWED